jgi:hypothetical protein
MKSFKIADCWISAIWITGFAVASIFYAKKHIVNETLVEGYFVVGCWQCISMIVHTIKGYFTQKGSVRYVYHCISLISVITLPVGSYYILYLAAPFMAIFYTWLCYHETFIKMKRPLSLLK